MEEVTNIYEAALRDLNSVKDREIEYAQINTLQNIVNRFAALIGTAEAMADHIAAQEGKTRNEVLQEYAV